MEKKIMMENNLGVDLHFRTFGSGPPLMILHGLFGSGDNWLTLARKWSTDHTIYLPDLRNHGRSVWTSNHDYQSMAEDVLRLMDQCGLSTANILGHSMGGKVSMTLALHFPDRVSTLTVVDIAPRIYLLNEHQHLLSTLAAVDLLSFDNRTQLDDYLAPIIPQSDTRQFILKNIYRSDEGVFTWRMNVQGLLANLNSVGDDSSFVGCGPVSIPALFIAGGASAYIRAPDEAGIRKLFPLSQLVRIPGAGHWVHSDAPDALSDHVCAFLNRNKKQD